MSRTQKLALTAGFAVLLITGSSLIPATSAAAEPQPSAHAPAQVHPGQPTPRTGTPRPAHTQPATTHAPTAPAHADPHADTHSADSHTADAHATDHADSHDPAHAPASTPSTTPDTLTPTYFGQTPDADTALTVLRDGNARWVSGNTQNPHSDESTRRETAENGQHPFATILTCADSRIPVERVFDRGIGELFVIRVAGNVVAQTEAGTIEYGVEHLNTPVIVVMGHTGCGAVKAACEGAETHGNIRSLITEIEPAVRRASTMHPSLEGAELADAAVRENVMQSMFDLLATSQTIRSAVDNGTVTIVGAIYNIATGEVEFLGQHPWQDGLISVMSDHAANTPRNQATADASDETTGGRAGH